MPSPVLQFSWTLTGKGWVETSLSDNVNHLTLTASYLSDAVTDLVRIVLSLLKGAGEGKCVWQQEPGEYRWLFSRQDEQVTIRILWKPENFSRQPDDRGECLLVVTSPSSSLRQRSRSTFINCFSSGRKRAISVSGDTRFLRKDGSN